MKKRKLLQRILANPQAVAFSCRVTLVMAFGFRLSRVNGSHHIFVHLEVRELVNLQNVNGKIKPYQVRQFLKLVEHYNLELAE